MTADDIARDSVRWSRWMVVEQKGGAWSTSSDTNNLLHCICFSTLSSHALHLFELILGDTLTHGTCARDSPLHHLQQTIYIVGTAPLLVRDDLTALLNFRLLNDGTVGTHAGLGVLLRETVGDERCAV